MKHAWCQAAQYLTNAERGGFEAILITGAGAHVEVAFKDVLESHLDKAQAITRVFNQQGPLDIWIIDPTPIEPIDNTGDVLAWLREGACARYFAEGYVNRCQIPWICAVWSRTALVLVAVCRRREWEIRSGVWVHERAQIHRDARIVAPAFIGRGAKIAQHCLITRCSNIESNCRIDYGTIVEDSSILSEQLCRHWPGGIALNRGWEQSLEP